ncbi:hypothetical protein EYF80_012775 [Liparis tanakae]|uniref:Uncharacterized protein n=1 Tax=Liparis tanakae TaxID=230148 RepID=A0A4Z2IFV1_9TELE|nr:hypothetical protein EYF80_012775 [Liparis tanakae]
MTMSGLQSNRLANYLPYQNSITFEAATVRFTSRARSVLGHLGLFSCDPAGCQNAECRFGCSIPAPHFRIALASAHHRRFINKDGRQRQDGRVNDATAVSSPPGGVMEADIRG